MHLPIDDPELVIDPLFAEDLLLIVPDDHQFANRSSMALGDLDDIPLLLPPKGTALRRILDRAAASAGITLRAQAEIDGVRLLASLAIEGYGAAIVPATAVPRRLKGDVQADRRSRAPPARRRLGATAPPGTERRGASGRHAAQRSRRARRGRPARCARRRRRLPARADPCSRVCLGRAPMPADLQIQAHLEGPATVLIRWLGDRRVVWVEVDAGEDGAVLSSITSSIIEVAAVTALEQRLPLVLVLSSRGADIDEGFRALHGWGRLAAALADCSGSSRRS